MWQALVSGLSVCNEAMVTPWGLQGPRPWETQSHSQGPPSARDDGPGISYGDPNLL